MDYFNRNPRETFKSVYMKDFTLLPGLEEEMDDFMDLQISAVMISNIF